MLDFLATYAVDLVQPYIKWISIAVVLAIFVAGAVIAFAAKEKFVGYIKTAVFSLAVYSVFVGILMLILEVIKHYDPEYLQDNYVNEQVVFYVLIPLAVTLTIILIGTVVNFFVSRAKYKNRKFVYACIGGLIGASVIVTLVLMSVYYINNISGDGYYTAEGASFNQTALYVGAVVITALAVAAALIFDKDNTPFNSKSIARAGIAIALSFALSYVTLFRMPQGGSITLASTLPVMLFAFTYGPKKGILIGFVYGMLQAVQDPYIIHPAQFLLDYPIAFTMLGFAGLFAKTNSPIQIRFALGAITASVLRFVAHVVSGVFAFGAYALDAGASSFLVYSVAYNSFVFVDILIAIAVGAILLSNKTFVRTILGHRVNTETEVE